MAIKQDIEIHPPFEEMASVRQARERAFRMAKSDLPVVVEGEPGTGRRTLAAVLVLMRETQHSASSLQLQGTDGIDDRFRKKLEAAPGKTVDVTVHHLETLSSVLRRAYCRRILDNAPTAEWRNRTRWSIRRIANAW